MSTGLPAPPTDGCVERIFCVAARTKSGSLEFRVTGLVRCPITGEHLTFERDPLRVEAIEYNFVQPRTARAECSGVSGGREDTTYRVDETELKAVLEQAVAQLAPI